MIYFDNAATSFQKPPEVEKAVCQAFHTIGNAGRGAHVPTLNASRLLYDTREKLAGLFHISDPSRISFACNATEALNTAIQGSFVPQDHVITTACEHNSVLRPLYRLEDQGMKLTILPADQQGQIAYEDLEKNLQENTKAVVLQHGSNLTGNVTDLEKVASFTKKHDLLLVVDASQTAGAYPIDAEKTGIDILCFTGHKGLLGPQGTGGLYVREGVLVQALKVGGSGIHSYDRSHPKEMPEMLEAGTVNGHGLAGLNAALTFISQVGVKTIHGREMALAGQFIQGIEKIKGVRLYGDLQTQDRTAIVSLNIGSRDSAEVSERLWEDYEICVRAGAHCAPLMHQALGTKNQGAVRFSFSYFNTEEEIRQGIEAVEKLAEELDTAGEL